MFSGLTAAGGLEAEYQTRLPDRRLLQAKLHEFYLLTGADPALDDTAETEKA